MKELNVRLHRSPDSEIDVGTLAEENHRVYFEYTPAFLETRLNLSPFKWPLRSGLIEHTDHAFGPLPGLFDDSLPDGWGLLLMDRHFRRQNIDPANLSVLDRLSYLGTRTMGILTYHPPVDVNRNENLLNLHELGKNAEEVFEGETADVLPQLLRAGGSPGGARPKVLVGLRDDQILSGEDDLPEGFEHWIVKFTTRKDSQDAGPVEYAYSLMARQAGLEMTPTRLLKTTDGKDTRHYFATKRFDREEGNRRVHVHTFGNLVHANFRIPSTDYADLFRVTRTLTRSDDDLLKLYRLMVFNIVAHNRDDHAKNFAFRMNDNTGQWSLAPAYDLTFAPGPGGEHTTTILGEGKNPTREHCLKLADQADIKLTTATEIISEVNESASHWTNHAEKAGCSKQITKTIASVMKQL